MSPLDRIKELAQGFIDGRDRSMSRIWEIETLLISDFLESDLYEDLSEAVSLYRPEEGAPYYGEEEMKEALESALRLKPSPSV
ncbi:hypothetical protein ACWEIM_30720 [Streptomyces sp. NPDC004778]